MPFTIYRRDGSRYWHYRGSVAGRQLRGSTKTTDKTTAKRIAAEIEARHWKGRLDGPEAVLTFANAAHAYLDAEKPARFIAAISAYWKDTPVKSITAGAIRQSALKLYPNASGATRNRQVIVPTQAIINHAARLELCSPLRVPRFPVERREKEPATWEWVEAFAAAASPHLGALAIFMFSTGARIGEAVSLTWDDVDLSRRRALIRQTKIGDERWAHLPGPCFAAIANIQDRTERVFKYASRSTAKVQWAKAVKRAGIRHLSFHACRHGFATALLQQGIDVVTIARLGGWKSPQHVFSTYGHASDDKTLTERITRPVSAQRGAAKTKRIAK